MAAVQLSASATTCRPRPWPRQHRGMAKSAQGPALAQDGQQQQEVLPTGVWLEVTSGGQGRGGGSQQRRSSCGPAAHRWAWRRQLWTTRAGPWGPGKPPPPPPAHLLVGVLGDDALQGLVDVEPVDVGQARVGGRLQGRGREGGQSRGGRCEWHASRCWPGADRRPPAGGRGGKQCGGSDVSASPSQDALGGGHAGGELLHNRWVLGGRAVRGLTSFSVVRDALRSFHLGEPRLVQKSCACRAVQSSQSQNPVQSSTSSQDGPGAEQLGHAKPLCAAARAPSRHTTPSHVSRQLCRRPPC